MKYYIYTLIDPRNNSIFYVGKGSKRRCYHHLYETSDTTINPIKYNKIQSIRSQGLEPIIEIISYHINEYEAYQAEKDLISTIGLHNLTNIQLGGQGGSGNASWATTNNPSYKIKGHTYEQIYGAEKALQLKRLRSISSSNRVFTDESRQLMSESAKNRDHSYKQKIIVTPEGEFDSLTEAAKHYNISPSAMCQRIKSKKNVNTFYYK